MTVREWFRKVRAAYTPSSVAFEHTLQALYMDEPAVAHFVAALEAEGVALPETPRERLIRRIREQIRA